MNRSKLEARPNVSWVRAAVIFLAGCAFADAAACAGGEDVLFDNTGKGGSSGGLAGSSTGASGSSDNGGSAGSGQGGSAQGGSSQGGGGQGGSGQGGSGQSGAGGMAQGGSAGTATGGSSGAGGSGGSASSDAGGDATTSCNGLAVVGTPVTGQGITLQYQNANANAADGTIQFSLMMTASTSLVLNELEVRYYFTNEFTKPTTFEVYYSGIVDTGRVLTPLIKTTLVSAALGPGSDSYLSYTINDTATIASGEQIKLDPALHSTNYVENCNECNDYSYDPTAAALKDNPRIAVYRKGVLIWGAPPGTPAAEGGTDAASSDGAAEAASSDAAVESAASDALVDSVSESSASDAADAAEASGD